MITRPISTEKQNFLKIFLESLMNEKSPPKKKILGLGRIWTRARTTEIPPRQFPYGMVHDCKTWQLNIRW
jgi:hypothetical protein